MKVNHSTNNHKTDDGNHDTNNEITTATEKAHTIQYYNSQQHFLIVCIKAQYELLTKPIHFYMKSEKLLTCVI